MDNLHTSAAADSGFTHKGPHMQQPDWSWGTLRDNKDTLSLRYASLNEDTCERFIIYVNGRTEWIEKYPYLPSDLGVDEDIGYLTFDHRGQGQSGGTPSFVEDYADYEDDAAAIIHHVTNGRPYDIVAHSMGGLVSLGATLNQKIAPERLILCSPLLGLPKFPVPPPLSKPISAMLSRFGLQNLSTGAGNHGMIPFSLNRLTHDPQKFRRIVETPYPIPGATFGWVDASFRAIENIFAPSSIQNLNAETLVLCGSKETVVDRDAIRNWVDVATEHSDAKISYRVITGARHELLTEIPVYYNEALNLIRQWLQLEEA